MAPDQDSDTDVMHDASTAVSAGGVEISVVESPVVFGGSAVPEATETAKHQQQRLCANPLTIMTSIGGNNCLAAEERIIERHPIVTSSHLPKLSTTVVARPSRSGSAPPQVVTLDLASFKPQTNRSNVSRPVEVKAKNVYDVPVQDSRASAIASTGTQIKILSPTASPQLQAVASLSSPFPSISTSTVVLGAALPTHASSSSTDLLGSAVTTNGDDITVVVDGEDPYEYRKRRGSLTGAQQPLKKRFFYGAESPNAQHLAHGLGGGSAFSQSQDQTRRASSNENMLAAYSGLLSPTKLQESAANIRLGLSAAGYSPSMLLPGSSVIAHIGEHSPHMPSLRASESNGPGLPYSLSLAKPITSIGSTTGSAFYHQGSKYAHAAAGVGPLASGHPAVYGSVSHRPQVLPAFDPLVSAAALRQQSNLPLSASFAGSSPFRTPSGLPLLTPTSSVHSGSGSISTGSGGRSATSSAYYNSSGAINSSSSAGSLSTRPPPLGVMMAEVRSLPQGECFHLALSGWDWFAIDQVRLPCVFRSGEKFLAVHMVQMRLLAKFPPNVPGELMRKHRMVSHKMSVLEAWIFNTVNALHCKFEYGYQLFSPQDEVVKAADVEKFYWAVKAFNLSRMVEMYRSEIRANADLHLGLTAHISSLKSQTEAELRMVHHMVITAESSTAVTAASASPSNSNDTSTPLNNFAVLANSSSSSGRTAVPPGAVPASAITHMSPQRHRMPSSAAAAALAAHQRAVAAAAAVAQNAAPGGISPPPSLAPMVDRPAPPPYAQYQQLLAAVGAPYAAAAAAAAQRGGVSPHHSHELSASAFSNLANPQAAAAVLAAQHHLRLPYTTAHPFSRNAF